MAWRTILKPGGRGVRKPWAKARRTVPQNHGVASITKPRARACQTVLQNHSDIGIGKPQGGRGEEPWDVGVRKLRAGERL